MSAGDFLRRRLPVAYRELLTLWTEGCSYLERDVEQPFPGGCPGLSHGLYLSLTISTFISGMNAWRQRFLSMRVRADSSCGSRSFAQRFFRAFEAARAVHFS